MTIPERDIKILWGRAAGYCSNCREKLTSDAGDPSAGRPFTIGEMAHIVAENRGGPRGDSLLTQQERDSYPNLLLLCRNCHRIVDADEKSWPIEKLHRIKSLHEVWVDENLAPHRERANPTADFYRQFLNQTKDALMLEHWVSIAADALHFRLPSKWLQDATVLRLSVYQASWPGISPVFEAKLKNLATRVAALTSNFEKRTLIQGTWAREDRSWKRTWHDPETFERLAAEEAEWRSVHHDCLFDLAFALTEFADAARKEVDRGFLLFFGRFGIDDHLGCISGSPTVYYPNSYRRSEEETA